MNFDTRPVDFFLRDDQFDYTDYSSEVIFFLSTPRRGMIESTPIELELTF